MDLSSFVDLFCEMCRSRKDNEGSRTFDKGNGVVLERLQKRGFQVEYASHAEAILTVDFPQALSEIEQVLTALKIPIKEIVMGGGGKSQATQRLRRDFERWDGASGISRSRN